MKRELKNPTTGILEWKEIEPFEDGNQRLLSELVNFYFVIKQKFQHKEIQKAFHDTNIAAAFRELYKVEFEDDEIIEFRDFCENDYPEWVQSGILNDYNNGMEDINLKKYGYD